VKVINSLSFDIVTEVKKIDEADWNFIAKEVGENEDKHKEVIMDLLTGLLGDGEFIENLVTDFKIVE